MAELIQCGHIVCYLSSLDLNVKALELLLQTSFLKTSLQIQDLSTTVCIKDPYRGVCSAECSVNSRALHLCGALLVKLKVLSNCCGRTFSSLPLSLPLWSGLSLFKIVTGCEAGASTDPEIWSGAAENSWGGARRRETAYMLLTDWILPEC